MEPETSERSRGHPKNNVRKKSRSKGGPPPKGPSGPPGSHSRGIRDLASWRDEQYIKDKLSAIKEPVENLPTLSFKDKKFQSRCRLYVTNLPNGITLDEFQELFKPFGEIDDSYLHREFFGFIRLDYYYNAMKAKYMLDNTEVKGRVIRVRFSPQSMIIVKNLPPFVTNELLHLAFSVFGEVDYCVVLADTRGHALDEGVVDFKYKKSLALAKKYCNEHYYLLNSYLKPVFVEDCDVPYDNEGVPDDQIKKPPAFFKSRQKGPRFAVPGSFEFKYAEKYKMLYEEVKAKTIQIKINLQDAERELENECEEAEFDYETERLREILLQRERERELARRGSNRYAPEETDMMEYHPREERMEQWRREPVTDRSERFKDRAYPDERYFENGRQKDFDKHVDDVASSSAEKRWFNEPADAQFGDIPAVVAEQPIDEDQKRIRAEKSVEKIIIDDTTVPVAENSRVSLEKPYEVAYPASAVEPRDDPYTRRMDRGRDGRDRYKNDYDRYRSEDYARKERGDRHGRGYDDRDFDRREVEDWDRIRKRPDPSLEGVESWSKRPRY